MTEGSVGPLGPHLDDERLSALLDGVAEPSDAAHADGCPECAARLAGWSQARRLVAVAPAVASEGQRDAAVQAALAAFDSSERAGGSGPIDLGAARRRRLAGISGGRGAAAAAAAAIVLVAGMAFGLSRIGHEHTTATSARSSEAASSTTAKAAAPSPPAGASASQARGVGAGPDSASPAQGSLGSFSDMAALIQNLRAQAPAARTPNVLYNSAMTSLGRCRAPFAAAGVSANTSPEKVATLEYDGTQAEVFVYAMPHSHIVVVVNASTCGVLARGAF